MSRKSKVEQRFYYPAETTEEAVARIFALTGRQPKTRGEKRALIALRDALGVDVDIVKTNAVLGKLLADKLDVDWDIDNFVFRNTVSLAGLNALLNGAQIAFLNGSIVDVQGTIPATLLGAEWEGFRPAISKIEAVTRIALLTGAPDEWLGPGGKEHKSLLVNLADRLLGGVELDRSSKTRMARDIALQLGTRWTDDCYSTGETISLLGLNTILAGAERRLGQLGSTTTDAFDSPEKEGAALVSAIFERLPGGIWNGRTTVEQMYESGDVNAHQTEWPGWFFEARSREILNEAFPPNGTPPRSRYGNTTFDYRLNRVWELKAHVEKQEWPISKNVKRGNPDVILNDEIAIRECVQEHGLGFLILSGNAVADEDRQFVKWHDAFKSGHGIKSASSNSRNSRVRKASFGPTSIEAFWIANTKALNAAVLAGQLSVRGQGMQAPRVLGEKGKTRKAKFHMHVLKARKSFRIAEHEWPGS